nr:hypothetical protein [Tanacetum cinerariifolium]
MKASCVSDRKACWKSNDSPSAPMVQRSKLLYNQTRQSDLKNYEDDRGFLIDKIGGKADAIDSPSAPMVQRSKLLYNQTRQSDLKNYEDDRGFLIDKIGGKADAIGILKF